MRANAATLTRPGEWTFEEKVAWANRYHASGWSISEIAQVFDVHEAVVLEWVVPEARP